MLSGLLLSPHVCADEAVERDARDSAFRKAGISIPFPQRDVHLYTPPVQERGEKGINA